MVILIPAFQPDDSLVAVVSGVRASDPRASVVVVDDGSGPGFAGVFARAAACGAIVVGQPVNGGKGHALKVGFDYVARVFPGEPVVCADADGQHRVDDVLAAGERVRDGAIVLGVRRFSAAAPWRSRFGNSITRAAFRLATGVRVTDTQTGLRGVPASLLAWLVTVPGERYEYELNVLLQATEAGIELDELPIATVYLAGNASSHFHPIVDSARIYGQLARFSLSSFGAFLIDAGAFFAFQALTGSLLLSAVMARVISASLNFLTNRRFVFALDRSRSFAGAAGRYAVLVAVILAANYALLSLLTGPVGLGLVWAKLLTEALLFSLSYRLQQRFVFGVPRRPTSDLAPVGTPRSPVAV